MTADTAQTSTTRAVQELMVQRAKESYARLPMLEVAFDRFALSLAQVLRSHFGGVAETELKSIDYLSCQEAIADLPDVALIAVTEAEDWGGTIAMIVSPELLFNIVEVTFGGRMCPAGHMRPPKVTSTMLNSSSGLTIIAMVPPQSSASVTAISATSGRSAMASWQDR